MSSAAAAARQTTFRLRVGQLTLQVDAAPASTRALRPPPVYRPFLASRGHDIRLTLTEEGVPRPPRSDLLFASGGVWRVYRFGEGLLYQFRSPACDPAFYKAVAIDEALTRGRLHFPPGRCRPGFALEYPLDELLFQHRLAREGHVTLHACGLTVGRKAVLFCGESGAGKSTTAHLWSRLRPGTLVLSDDRIVVRGDGRGRRAFGTPWHGEARFGAAASRGIAAVFVLRHARRTTVRPLTPGEAAGVLFARSFPPPWDALAVGRILESCCDLAATTPCYELRFRPDESAVTAVLATLRDLR